MSGVYIKGLKMPKNCRECPFLYVTRICDGTKGCPLIPIETREDALKILADVQGEMRWIDDQNG